MDESKQSVTSSVKPEAISFLSILNKKAGEAGKKIRLMSYEPNLLEESAKEYAELCSQKPNESICTSCDGTGEVEGESFDDKQSCLTCNGSGKWRWGKPKIKPFEWAKAKEVDIWHLSCGNASIGWVEIYRDGSYRWFHLLDDKEDYCKTLEEGKQALESKAMEFFKEVMI